MGVLVTNLRLKIEELSRTGEYNEDKIICSFLVTANVSNSETTWGLHLEETQSVLGEEKTQRVQR